MCLQKHLFDYPLRIFKTNLIYGDYDKYFVKQLPFTATELVEMSKLTLDDLKAAASRISIEDAASRAAK